MASNPDPLVQAVARERQRICLGPIAAAPLAHIAMTMHQLAKTAQQKQLILGLGAVGSAALTVSMRLWLLAFRACCPGAEAPHLAQCRMKTVLLEEKKKIK